MGIAITVVMSHLQSLIKTFFTPRNLATRSSWRETPARNCYCYYYYYSEGDSLLTKKSIVALIFPIQLLLLLLLADSLEIIIVYFHISNFIIVVQRFHHFSNSRLFLHLLIASNSYRLFFILFLLLQLLQKNSKLVRVVNATVVMCSDPLNLRQFLQDYCQYRCKLNSVNLFSPTKERLKLNYLIQVI